MTKPSIAPGVQTKTKLKAFQFIEGHPSSQPQDAEPIKETEPIAHPELRPQQTPVKAAQQQPPPAVDKLPLPSTPATRLPLADLIGNPEDKLAQATNISPEEHVLWLHAQTPASSQPLATPPRKRKRARSSSPASSQHGHLKLFPEGKDAFTTEKLHHSLKTPQGDPASDLWEWWLWGGQVCGILTSYSGCIAAIISNCRKC